MTNSAGARSAAVAALFDRVADVYDTVDVPWFTPIAQGLVAELQPRPGERALDLGTGRGAALWPLVDAVGPAGHVTGLDLSTGMIDATRRSMGERGHQLPLDLVVGDAAAPDPALGPVDIVAASLVLFFLPEPAAALQAWTALLAPGGRLGISTFGPRSPAWARLDDVFTPHLPPQLLDARTSGTRGPFASDAGVEELLSAAGLVDVRTVTTTLPVHFDDVEQWRAWSSSHGQRSHWDAVAPGDRDEVLAEAGRRLEETRDPAGGFTLEQTVRYTLGRRPN